MPPQQISIVTIVALIFLSVPPTMGYQSVSGSPFARPFGVQDVKSDTVLLKEPQHATTRRNKPTCGLEKNKPVYGIDTSRHEDIEDAARFLVEHESVRAYPSPLLQPTSEVNQQPSSKPKKVLPKVQLKRRAADLLSIGNNDTSDIPQIRTTQSGAQLDLNTVWVEMMIHSEQSKLIPAALSI